MAIFMIDTSNTVTINGVKYCKVTQIGRTRKESPGSRSKMPNQNKMWTASENKLLREMLKEGRPVADIAEALGRSVRGVELHIKLFLQDHRKG